MVNITFPFILGMSSVARKLRTLNALIELKLVLERYLNQNSVFNRHSYFKFKPVIALTSYFVNNVKRSNSPDLTVRGT